MISVTYIHHNTIAAIKQVENGTENRTFLELIYEHNISAFDAPCGGNGTCGKCRIIILSGKVSEPTAVEIKLLTGGELAAGVRLACQCSPLEDVEIELSAQDFHDGSILS
jgi:ferredoxin